MLDVAPGEAGDILWQWSLRDFTDKPDRDEVIAFAAQTHDWHAAYPALFAGAEMVKPAASCGTHTLHLVRLGRTMEESTLLHTAWHDPASGKTVEFLANYTDAEEGAVLDRAVTLRRTPDAPAVEIQAGESVPVPPRTIWAVEY